MVLGPFQQGIVALQETHRDSDVMTLCERLFNPLVPKMGALVQDYAHAGVGLLASPDCAWHVEPLCLASWLSASSCQYCRSSPAILLYLGSSSRRFVVYTFYGFSKARSNAKDKIATHVVISAARIDSASCGLPAILGEDCNLEMYASHMLAHMPSRG